MTAMSDKPQPATEIGSSSVIRSIVANDGHSIWIEDGVWYTAPTVDPKKFGGHAYDNGGYAEGIRDCPCGASMHDSSSSGPVDPFGACPCNPLPLPAEQDTEQQWKDWDAREKAARPSAVVFLQEPALPSMYDGLRAAADREAAPPAEQDAVVEAEDQYVRGIKKALELARERIAAERVVPKDADWNRGYNDAIDDAQHALYCVARALIPASQLESSPTAAVEGAEDSKDSVNEENCTMAASVVVDKDSSVSADLQLAKEDYAHALGFAEGLGLGTYEEMIRLHWKTDGLHIDDYTQHYKDKLGAVERQRVEALRVMRQAKKSSEASSNPERGQDGPASLPESSLPTTVPESIVRSKDVFEALGNLFKSLRGEKLPVPVSDFALCVYQSLSAVPEISTTQLAREIAEKWFEKGQRAIDDAVQRNGSDGFGGALQTYQTRSVNQLASVIQQSLAEAGVVGG